uniref:Uncharacterized protein n=1 Tax=Kalanchoe fedtschenkoi TaxID=63787 RepID=A0A7N0ULN7_KALFE
MMRVVKEESDRLHLEIEENIDAERYKNNAVLGCPSRSYQMDSAPNNLPLDANFGTSLEFDGIHCEFWKWLESFVYPRVVWPMCRASILLRVGTFPS